MSKHTSLEDLKKSVAEEYKRMKNARCDCGGIYHKSGHQSIIKDENHSSGTKIISRIVANCAECGEERLFDTLKTIKLYPRGEEN